MKDSFDTRIRENIFPVKIIKITGNVKNEKALLEKQPLQINLSDNYLTVMKNGKDGEDASILLDFGREINGSLRILTFSSHSKKPVKVHISYGESVMETLSKIGKKNSTNDHAIRDFEYFLPSYSDMTFNETGFRFALIRLPDKNTEISVKSVVAVSIYRDLKYKGAFRCDNEILNKIYDTASYTCHLCMQQYIWDGIKRDRLVWVGDMHPEMLTIRTVFGNVDLVKDTLNFIRESTPLPNWMNNFPTYSLWWLIILKDWYLYTGDNTFLNENIEYIKQLSKQISNCVNLDGSDNLGEYFLDWPTYGTEAGKQGSRGLLVIALEAAVELLNYVGETEIVKECKSKITILRKCKWNYFEAKQTAAMLALANCYNKKTVANFIMKNGAEGFSTFMSYYLLKVAGSEDMATALGILEEYYGTMLSLGATSFWEDFDIKWANNAVPIDQYVQDNKYDVHGNNGAFCYKGFRHSLCHGWSSAVTAFLAEEVLGIHILSAGCRKIQIKPNLGNLKRAEGRYPTPYGVIKVKHRRLKDGTVETKYSAPKEIEIIM